VLGEAVIDEVYPMAEQIVATAAAAVSAGADTETVDVDVALADGRALVGSVADVVGDVVLAVTYSRVAPKHRLAAWVRLLAVSAARPDRPFSAVTVGRGRDGAGLVTIPPLGAQDANERLEVLVDLYLRGMAEPLPLYCDTSAAYAAAPSNGRRLRAGRKWTTPPRASFDSEDRDPAHVLVLGDVVPFDHLERAAPAADEHGAEWHDGVSSRFGRYALRLWCELLRVEQRSGI
jgi:exodeoxyribonuclease V gamma subunit